MDSLSITGWTVFQGRVGYIGGYWQPAHGSRSLDLNGLGVGGIRHSFATTPGMGYEVALALAGNPDVHPHTAAIRVWVDDPNMTYQDFSFDLSGQSHTNMGWVYRT